MINPGPQVAGLAYTKIEYEIRAVEAVRIGANLRICFSFSTALSGCAHAHPTINHLPKSEGRRRSLEQAAPRPLVINPGPQVAGLTYMTIEYGTWMVALCREDRSGVLIYLARSMIGSATS